jgi:hypothetical protein
LSESWRLKILRLGEECRAGAAKGWAAWATIYPAL